MILNSNSGMLEEVARPEPSTIAGSVLIRVLACGVCRTDLHILDGDLPACRPEVIPGHQVVGEVIEMGEGVEGLRLGDRVGVPWLGHTCQSCSYCSNGMENLCDRARFTGYHLNGGFAEVCLADARYCFRIPERYPSEHAAPLLCAGFIGYRALRMAGDAEDLGLFGFGASAHILAQVAVFEGRRVSAFTRDGDDATQDFARSLGAVWAGGASETPPGPLDAAIIFAPVGLLVPTALRNIRKGGIVVCAGIHMSDIPSFPYSLLWGERQIRSVANLTRRDGEEFLMLAPRVPVETNVRTYGLSQANHALEDLRGGHFSGAAVIVPSRS